MNKKVIFSFLSGIAVGSIVTAIIVKHNERKKFDEEMEDVVSGLRDGFQKVLKKKKKKVEKEDTATENRGDISSKSIQNNDSDKINRREQYAKAIANYKETEDEPFLISADFYGDDGHNEMQVLYMYSDGVITHEKDDIPLDAVEKNRLLGDTLEDVDDGEYDDRFYVRCPEKGTDYEVVLIGKEFYP